MKRIIYFAAALLLAACSREIIPETSEIVETPESKTYTVSLQATLDPETRLSFSTSNGEGTWDSGDQVALFTQGGNMVTGNVTYIDGSSATFTFTIQEGDKIVDGATVYYPASIAVADNPYQIVLPASFDDLEVMKKTIPMKATVNGKSMAFQHLASMVYVDPFTSTPSHPSDRSPQFVVFSVGENDTPITGTFTVGDGTLTPVGTSGTTSIRATWTEGKGYCFVLPATTYDGFTFSIISDITNVDGREVYFTFAQKKRSSPFTAQLAHMLKMPSFDPQCKEFYLTSAETNWSDNVTSARMIQTGPNSFLGALDSHRGPLGDRDLGLRILQGFNLGTAWYNVIGGRNDNDIASYGESVGNFPGGPRIDEQGNVFFGVYKVSITLYDNNWRYTSEWVDDAWDLEWDDQGNHRILKIVGDFDHWEKGGIQLNQIVRHNWTAQIEVSTDSMIKPGQDYEWKIKRDDRDDEWKVNWGRDPGQSYGYISSSQLSSYLQIKDDAHQDPPNCTLNLPAGTYNVFFNDAIGWIMFEKI